MPDFVASLRRIDYTDVAMNTETMSWLSSITITLAATVDLAGSSTVAQHNATRVASQCGIPRMGDESGLWRSVSEDDSGFELAR